MIFFAAITICSAWSFHRNEILKDEVPRHHHHLKTREFNKENNEKLSDIERALISVSREKKEVENEGKMETKRINGKGTSLQDYARRQRALKLELAREKEMLIRELLSDMTRNKFTGNSNTKREATSTKTLNSPPKHAIKSHHKAGKHREREREMEKERDDHHGRRQRIRIHEQERERKHHRMINGQLVNELEKEMRGRRQRMTKQNGRIRQEEERFRERERSRVV